MLGYSRSYGLKNNEVCVKEKYNVEVQIGNQTFLSRIFLAPLSSCSDLAFRLISRQEGARFCFFEMLDAQSLLHKSPRAWRILQTNRQDQPVGAQLLGVNPEEMLAAANMILEHVPIQVLDINAACPVRKVFNKGSGACFMQKASELYSIIETLAKNLSVPITVKMRVGLNAVDPDLAVSFAKNCESAGAAALFVHGRCRAQENYGPVRYDAIRAVKNAVRVPVIGSGNVLNPLLAKKMLDESGADGVLIAKGSFGYPSIFSETEEYLRTGVWQPAMDLHRKLALLEQHLEWSYEFNGEMVNRRIGAFAKICLWYIKGFPEASRYRARFYACQNIDALRSLINEIKLRF